MRLFVPLLLLFLVSCEATLCDCIQAEKKSDGTIKDEKLKIFCDKLMSERKKELEKLPPNEQKKFIEDHEKEVQNCLEQ